MELERFLRAAPTFSGGILVGVVEMSFFSSNRFRPSAPSRSMAFCVELIAAET